MIIQSLPLLETEDAASLWMCDLKYILFDCGESGLLAEAALLGRAYRLLSCAPLAYQDLISNLPSRRTFDTLVSAGAYESAALRLMPRRLGFFLSRGPGRADWLASSCIDGRDEDMTFGAITASGALLGAYLSQFAASTS